MFVLLISFFFFEQNTGYEYIICYWSSVVCFSVLVFGFLLGIRGLMYWFGTLDYETVFANASDKIGGGQVVAIISGHEWSIATVICICLFVGAMGKSAQVPLHVWLPDRKSTRLNSSH